MGGALEGRQGCHRDVGSALERLHCGVGEGISTAWGASLRRGRGVTAAWHWRFVLIDALGLRLFLVGSVTVDSVEEVRRNIASLSDLVRVNSPEAKRNFSRTRTCGQCGGQWRTCK